jgi:hypothetical protein
MMALAQDSPAAIGFDALFGLAQARLGARHAAGNDDRNALASDLLQAFAAGVVELHSMPSRFVTQPGTQPQASAVAILQASRGAQVTNLRHDWITIDNETRRLLPMLTGGRSEQELAMLAWPNAPAHEALEKLGQALSRFARQALLVS